MITIHDNQSAPPQVAQWPPTFFNENQAPLKVLYVSILTKKSSISFLVLGSQNDDNTSKLMLDIRFLTFLVSDKAGDLFG